MINAYKSKLFNNLAYEFIKQYTQGKCYFHPSFADYELSHKEVIYQVQCHTLLSHRANNMNTIRLQDSCT